MKKITLDDLIFDEECQYKNPVTGCSHINGLIPGSIFYSSLNGNIDIDDADAVEEILEKIFADKKFDDTTYIRIADYSNIIQGSFKARQKYMNTIKRLNKEHNCNPLVTYICGANTITKVTLLFAQKMLGQNFIFVSSVDEAFELVNNEIATDGYTQLTDTGYKNVMVQQKDIDALVELTGSAIWSIKKNEEINIDPDSPMYILYKAMQVISEDTRELMKKEREHEQKVLQSEALERTYSETSPDFIITLSKDGIIKRVNRNTMGLDKDEVVGQQITSFLPEESRFIFEKALNNTIETKTMQTFENVVSLPEGDRYFLNRLNPLFTVVDEDILVLIATDITERKQTEELLIAERHRLANILKGTNVGTWEWNIQTGDTIYNERWAEIIGYTLFELSNVSIETWKKYTHPEDYKKAYDLLQKHFKGELEYYECEYRMRHKNGDWIWVNDRGQVTTWSKEGIPLIMSGTHLEITKRKRAEEMQERSKQQFMDAMFNSPDAMLLIDNETFVECNAAAAIMLGCESREQVKNTHPSVFSPFSQPDGRESKEKADEMIKTALQSGTHRFEWNHKKVNGEVFPVEVSLAVTPVAINDRTVLQCIWRDLTRIKKAEEQINLVNERMSIAADSAGIGVWDMDLVKKELHWDEWMYRLTGVNPMKFDETFSNWMSLVYKDDLERVKNDFDQAIVGEKEYDTEFRIVEPDGNIKYLKANAIVIRDEYEYPIRITGINYDITKSKKTEEELRKSEKKHRTLFESSSDAILLLDPECGYVDCNPAALKMFKAKDKEEFLQLSPERLSPKFQPGGIVSAVKAKQEIEKAFNDGSNFFEWTHKRLDGEEFQASVLAVSIELNNRRLFYGTIRDITQRKQDDARLKSFALQMELKNQELDQAVFKAEAATTAKSEFLANMSHEIRTPLNGVIGFTDLLMNTPLSNIQKQYVENANTSAHSLLGIINDILDFSKIEAGKLELDEINTDIIELTEQAIDIIKYNASKKGLELLLNIQPDIPRYAFVDSVRLKQILVNLLSNAVKFTDKGEVELSVTYRPNKKNESEGIFSFSVKDTGIGISTDNQRKLFRAFSQADTSITRKFGGTGLGLVISNMLAEKMGSEIKLESEIDKGSRFYFSICKLCKAGEPIDNTPLIEINNVLIVDDNENNRLIMKDMLNHWNINSKMASNGLEALDIIEKSEAFDIVMIDYNMPYLNGLDTVKLIRNKLDLPPEDQPLILLHCSSDDDLILKECEEVGIIFRLIKPVKMTDLYNILSSISNPQLAEQPEELQQQILISDDTADAGFQILIAEDVNVNMALIKILLSQLIPSAKLIEAKNGKIALEKYVEHLPDLIFMDIQMPEMDGYSVTTEIRRMEMDIDLHTPIIALTAGAVKGEKEKCFNSGMDDYLTKPIEQTKLKSIMEKFVITKKEEEKKWQYPSTLKQVHFDRDDLLERSGGDRNLILTLIKVTSEQFPDTIEILESAVSTQNYEVIHRSAHSIKGISLTMSFNILMGLASEMEKTPADKMDKIKELFKKMKKEWSNIQIELGINMN